jgi:hypothetical protein
VLCSRSYHEVQAGAVRAAEVGDVVSLPPLPIAPHYDAKAAAAAIAAAAGAGGKKPAGRK